MERDSRKRDRHDDRDNRRKGRHHHQISYDSERSRDRRLEQEHYRYPQSWDRGWDDYYTRRPQYYASRDHSLEWETNYARWYAGYRPQQIQSSSVPSRRSSRHFDDDDARYHTNNKNSKQSHKQSQTSTRKEASNDPQASHPTRNQESSSTTQRSLDVEQLKKESEKKQAQILLLRQELQIKKLQKQLQHCDDDSTHENVEATNDETISLHEHTAASAASVPEEHRKHGELVGVPHEKNGSSGNLTNNSRNKNIEINGSLPINVAQVSGRSKGSDDPKDTSTNTKSSARSFRSSKAHPEKNPHRQDVIDTGPETQALEQHEEANLQTSPKLPSVSSVTRTESTRKAKKRKRSETQPSTTEIEGSIEATKSSKNKRYGFHEKDFESSFVPTILDFSLIGCRKFLVKWEMRSSLLDSTEECPSKTNNSYCQTWVRFDDFLFPSLAKKFLSKKVKDQRITSKSVKNKLTLWKSDCLEKLSNYKKMFNTELEEEGFLQEVDFCCFLCKCPWDHPLKGYFRNCEYGLKYHRGCCHGYLDHNDFCEFISPVGKVLMEGMERSCSADCDASNGGAVAGRAENHVKIEDTHDSLNETESNCFSKPTHIPHKAKATIVEGDTRKFLNCVQDRIVYPNNRHDVVVLCINAGIGGATMALKELNVGMKTVIHVEQDRVARHVYSANHDFHYGEVTHDDGIQHISGLYECLEDLIEDPESLVRKHGPVDVILFSSQDGKSRDDTKKDIHDFYQLVKAVERYNLDIYKSGFLFHFAECALDVVDLNEMNNLSHSIYESKPDSNNNEKRIMMCNWPLGEKNYCLKELNDHMHNQREEVLPDRFEAHSSQLDENLKGFSENYVTRPVFQLFLALRTAYTVGLSRSKWRDKLHPKFWEFLNLGPRGYNMKLSDSFGENMFCLLLWNPTTFTTQSNIEYAQQLLQQSISIPCLVNMLRPLKQLFSEKIYKNSEIPNDQVVASNQTHNPLSTNSEGASCDGTQRKKNSGQLNATAEETSKNTEATPHDTNRNSPLLPRSDIPPAIGENELSVKSESDTEWV